MSEKRYWIVRAYQGERLGYDTQQFLSLDDAVRWAQHCHNDLSHAVELYEARPVALSFEPAPETLLDKSRWTGPDSETPAAKGGARNEKE